MITALAEMSFFEYLSRLFSVQFFVQLPPARDAWFCIRDLTSFLIISVAPVITNEQSYIAYIAGLGSLNKKKDFISMAD